MERLTKYNERGRACFTGSRSPFDNTLMIPDVLSRLAAYEDSGLTPEEVAELAKIVSCKDCVHCTALNLGGYICENKDTPWYREDDIVRVNLDDCCKYGLREKE